MSKRKNPHHPATATWYDALDIIGATGGNYLPQVIGSSEVHLSTRGSHPIRDAEGGGNTENTRERQNFAKEHTLSHPGEKGPPSWEVPQLATYPVIMNVVDMRATNKPTRTNIYAYWVLPSVHTRNESSGTRLLCARSSSSSSSTAAAEALLAKAVASAAAAAEHTWPRPGQRHRACVS